MLIKKKQDNSWQQRKQKYPIGLEVPTMNNIICEDKYIPKAWIFQGIWCKNTSQGKLQQRSNWLDTLNGSSCASSLKKELLLGHIPVIYGTKE